MTIESGAHAGEVAQVANARPASWALTAAMLLILVWGVNFSLQKFIFSAIGPGAFLFVRYLIMPACAIGLLVYRHGRHWPRLPRADLWALARLGVAGHFLHVGMVTYGIHWSTAFSSSLILACGPLFTLLLLRIKGLESLHKAQVTGIALALVGVLLFLSDKLLGGQWRATGGDLLLLVAASFFSYYTVGAKPLIERHGGVVTMTYATLLGSVPVLLLSFPAGLAAPWAEASWLVWVSLGWSVLVASFAGWLVWGWVNAVRGVARTAPLIYLMPPVAGAVAWLFAGEQYTTIKLAGAALTLVGVAVAQFSSPATREVPAPVD